jgi:hypothetical protein
MRVSVPSATPAGTRKVADRDGLGEKRDMASLYVGETARSISERALEHWRDAEPHAGAPSCNTRGRANPP